MTPLHLTDHGHGLATVGIVLSAHTFGMFALSRIPRLTKMVGYDPRFTHGDYGIWVECPPEKASAAEGLLREHGAVEVRRER